MFWSFYQSDHINLSDSALGDPEERDFYCDCILYYVAVTFPIGHMLMVFLILLPKKILSRQTEADFQIYQEESLEYCDLYLIPEDNMTREDVTVKLD